jgi:alpha-tubulin suppressor-like RCC1 family protein
MRDQKYAPLIVCVAIVALGLGGCGRTNTVTTTTNTAVTANGRPVVYSWGVVGSDSPAVAVDAGLQSTVPRAVSGIAGTVTQIATSNSDIYALTSTGTVWAWGLGGNGELGNGTTAAVARAAVQVKFPAGVTIASLPNPMPFDTGVAIDTHGDVWGWGYDRRDELCLPASGMQLVPKQLPLTDVTLASGAGGHLLFDSKGKVYACGINTYGELGTGNTEPKSTPTAVVGLPDVGVKKLVSSWQGSGALMANGSYYDWGFNKRGLLGDDRTTSSSVPVHVALPATVTQVSQGGSNPSNGQTIAILSNGTVWTWGNGAKKMLPARLVLPHGVVFTKVCSGGASFYAIDSSGVLWAWGADSLGQLGNSDKGSEAAPVSIGTTLTQVSSTSNNAAGFFKG